MIRVKNIRAYRSNGPGYEECPRESWSRTRKWCLPGARTGRDRGPPCRSRRRSRSEARNSRRSPPRPRSSFPPTGSRRGIASESTPSPRETFPRITCLPLFSLSLEIFRRARKFSSLLENSTRQARRNSSRPTTVVACRLSIRKLKAHGEGADS